MYSHNYNLTVKYNGRSINNLTARSANQFASVSYNSVNGAISVHSD